MRIRGVIIGVDDLVKGSVTNRDVLLPFSYVLRLKEYERERRLMERAARIAKKQAAA